MLLVNGIGGMGKTELCRSFFWEHCGKFKYAGWIDFSTSIAESFAGQMEPEGLSFGEKETIDQRYAKIMRYLRDLGSDGLLIVDNIEDMKDENISDILSLPFNVLASSRKKCEEFEMYDLDILDGDSCRALFYRYYDTGILEDEELGAVIELAGNHTLTVELLARTAKEAALTIGELHKKLVEVGFNLSDTVKEGVSTKWHEQREEKPYFEHLLKVFEISELSEEEKYILVNISVLPSAFIDKRELKEWLGVETLRDINSLVKKGWIKEGEGFRVVMHQIVQETVRVQLKPDFEKCKALVNAMEEKLYLKPRENPLNLKLYVDFGSFIGKYVYEENLDIARLYNNMSSIYQDMGKLDEAMKYQSIATKIREKVLGQGHSELAISYNNLSSIYQDMGNYKEALEYQQKAVEIRKKVLEKDHPDLAQSYNNLASIYRAMGKYKKALEYQQKAVEISEKVLEKDHPSLAASYNNLSLIYQDMGKYKEALEHQQKAVEISEKVQEKDHPSLATSYNNLSTIFFSMSNLQKAIEYGEKAVSIMKSNFPDGHPKLDLFIKNLTYLKQLKNKPKAPKQNTFRPPIKKRR